MLYVFYVDIGKRLQLDMNLINGSVANLKLVLEETLSIPSNKQVLLISGGECLEESAKVCNYSAGTDTNPFFLFNRQHLERGEKPNVSAEYRPNNQFDAELNQLFDSVMSSTTPATIYTIHKINQLAQKFLEVATDTKVYCDQLNSDQLLQQQGWAAAIANLDDVLENFRMQCDAFDAAYNRYLETRDENLNLINKFSEEDLKLLSKIPLLPALLDNNEEERARLEMCCDASELSDLTLLQWISSKEPNQSLENVVETCKAALIKYDEHSLVSLKADIQNIFHPDRLKLLRSNADIQENLMTLSGLIVTIKDNCDEQAKKASGIKRNHDRANELKEECILQDLLDTHQDTLRMMKSNHMNLKSCRQLCTQSKKELCDVIHNRLKDIMNLQEQAGEIQSMLSLHSGNFKEIRAYVHLIQQLHTTPRNYLAAVSEVVRRRSYSQAFLMWASDLACRIFNIYTEETDRRKKFLSQFGGHFLNSLFPGLDDVPPTFATQSPPLFDNNLPALCEDDLNQLCQNVPDLKEYIELPDVDSVRNFFLSKSLTLSEVECNEQTAEKTVEGSVNEQLAVVMSAAGINDHSTSFSKSEPPTQDMITSSDSNYCTQNSASISDSSKQSDKAHEKDLQTMRETMRVLTSLTQNALNRFRNDITCLQRWWYSNQSEFMQLWNNVQIQLQHQMAHIQNLCEAIESKDNRIKALLAQISHVEMDNIENNNSDDKIQKQIHEAVRKERQLAIKEVTEQLNHDHRREIESMRQRFKLMASTNMERCPSETNLERIERNEMVDVATHEGLINRLKYDMEIQLKKVIEEERYNNERKLEEQLKQFENEKRIFEENIKTSLITEFDERIDTMRIRETALLAELQRHKETIHTLTGPESTSVNALMRRIDELEQEKVLFQSELINERQLKYSCVGSTTSQSSSIAMITSVNDDGSATVLNSSPELPQNKSRYKERIAYKKSRASPSSALGKLCIQSCNAGDPVLVVWDETIKNYTILQESSTLHFLHPTSMDGLGLKPASNGSPKKLYCPAIVIEKEYCVPKKSTTRYNVKEGERFYRVKVRPLKSVIPTT